VVPLAFGFSALVRGLGRASSTGAAGAASRPVGKWALGGGGGCWWALGAGAGAGCAGAGAGCAGAGAGAGSLNLGAGLSGVWPVYGLVLGAVLALLAGESQWAAWPGWGLGGTAVRCA
jgi:hypothetical protein